MSFRIAVASSDGKVINQHFGRARQFLIFEIKDDDYKFVELRPNTPACDSGEHHEDAMRNTVEALSDCGVVLVSQIGAGAVEALRGKGIQSFAVSDFIDKALVKIKNYIKTRGV
ncbi:MAG: dinitrogenase iron-molybdenum cofactor biosynthesis protein [Clostridia bacterium]|nr:dinitrogenase iron-molybdenum cofactor biosynthesis protein [Clostridia bacterium]